MDVFGLNLFNSKEIMKVLFQLGHPAHFHLFKNVINSLKVNKHKIYILIKKKDILTDLLNEAELKYYNILPYGRKDNILCIMFGQIKQDLSVIKFCLKNKPDLLVGTSVAISHAGKLLKIPSINVNEDDAEIVPLYAKLAYPWANIILAPSVCSTGKWKYKTINYNSYHELSYLHPNVFVPNKKIVEKYINPNTTYFLIRFSKLSAHHDQGVKGINYDTALKIISILKNYGKIYITSERRIEPNFEKYRIAINPLDIHHVMAFSQLFIGDSQTMAAESGVLGVPFIRFNDFVGKIGYLNELEENYKLGFGIKPSSSDLLVNKVKELLELKDRKQIYIDRKNKMLKEKIDLSKFIVWFIENYPASISIMKINPDYQYNFR